MYSPSHYRESRIDLILPFIESYSFATLLTPGSSEMISHLPFIVVTGASGEIELLSHMARANPHWRELERAGSAKVVFLGPHGYVSPAWYSPAPDNVPTWNYAAVHATGPFEVIGVRSQALGAMDRLVSTFENRYKTGWTMPKDEPALEALMNHIVVFKMKQVQFDAKFKLSQKQGVENRESVIRHFDDMESEDSRELAKYMKLTTPNMKA